MNDATTGHVSEEDIRSIAKLAMLHLSEEEISRASEDLSNILGSFQEIKMIRTVGVASADDVSGESNIMREDVVRENLFTTPEELLKNASLQDGYVKVSAVFAETDIS